MWARRELRPASPPVEQTEFSRMQAIVAALLFSMTVLNYLDRQALSVVAPVMRRELGLAQAEYAWAVTAFLIAYAVMYTGSGMVLDRIGYRAGLALFVLLWSTFSALHASIGGLASLVAFRFLLGLAEPGGLTGAVKTVSARFNAAQRGLVTGFFIAGTAVGSLIATPLIVLLSVRYGWRAAFLIAGAAGFLWAPLWLLATRNGRHDATPAEPLGEKRRGLAVLKDRRARAYVVARLFGDGLPYFLMFWLPEYLMSARHFSFALVGLIGWIPFLATDAGALLGGWLSGRLVRSGLPPLFSRKTMMSTASLFVGAGAWLQCFDAPWQVLLSLCFCTFGAGIWSANSHSIPGDAFPSSVVATVHGLGGSAGAIGGILLNTAVGQLSEAGSYWTIFLILATLQPLGVSSLWLWLHDEQGRRRELVT